MIFDRARLFLAFWKEHGAAVAISLIRTKLGNALAGRPVFSKPAPGTADGRPVTVTELALWSLPALRPLPTFLIPESTRPRISMVTDSIGSSSLFGGVGTALLFASQLANRMGATLRVVTRTEPPSPANALQVLNAYGIKLNHEMQFAFAPVTAPSAGAPTWGELDLQPGEIFITTSWWSTAATLPSVPHASIIYLLQEDERMFHPFGEERLRCEEVLRNRSIRFVINTRLLFDHMIASGLEHFSTQAQWFEPAFPPALFHEREREPAGKRRLFFYARPGNPRNLFGIGLAVIERAIDEGSLDLDRWDIFFVGSGIPKLIFGDGYQPIRCEGLGWKAYADLIGTIDLGLSLMYTPHPSYPPFDLAASGAVVVTNRFGNKQDLSGYSRNILCADLDVESLLEGLKAGIALAEDKETRRRNHLANGLGTNWPEAFEATLQALTAGR